MINSKRVMVYMDPLFGGSKLKVKRANQHIDELQSILTAFLKTDFYNINVEKNVEDGQYELKFKVTQEFPREIPLVIGDVVHNLRSSLDLMTSEIVIKAGSTPDSYTKFPFYETRQELVGAINGGKIETAPKTIIDLIVDTIKPYKGGNDPLYALHNLDIVDKHVLLIPTVSVIALLNASAEDEGHNVFQFAQITVRESGKLNLVSSSHKINITDYGQPAFGVFFDKGQVFEGQPVIPTLHQLSQLVFGIIDAIEKAYLAIENNTI